MRFVPGSIVNSVKKKDSLLHLQAFHVLYLPTPKQVLSFGCRVMCSFVVLLK